MQFRLKHLNYDISDPFFFFIYLFKNFFVANENSETTKRRKLKFGDMISLYMELSTCIFGDNMSRGLEQTYKNL